jgi:hypothetical protein
MSEEGSMNASAGPAAAARKALEQQRLQNYRMQARQVREKHAAQDLAAATALRTRYQAPIFGEAQPWALVEKLAQCTDPSDLYLFTGSQWLHCLQIIDAMESDGMASEDFIVAAIVHDLGKLALLAGEAPEHVLWMNRLLAGSAPGAGLDQCVLQWSADDLGWSRLKDFLPDPLGWLIRYHSISIKQCEPYMDARDRDYVERWLRPFRQYDLASKSPFYLPRRRLEDYRPVLEKYLPTTIVF